MKPLFVVCLIVAVVGVVVVVDVMDAAVGNAFASVGAPLKPALVGKLADEQATGSRERGAQMRARIRTQTHTLAQ